MSEKIKGYVVKGIDLSNGDGADVWAMAGGERLAMVDERCFATEWTDIAGAEDAVTTIRRWRDVGLGDVRIFAVAEDGTEAPLRTYEEALDEVGQLCAEVNLARGRTMAALAQLAAIEAAIPSSIVATHTEHGAPMGLAARVRILAVEATCEVETTTALAAARAEIERLRGVVGLARRLIRSADINTTSGTRAAITCDEEPYAALVDIFEAEREAARLIPGLACVECDKYIYRGQEYSGKGGHAAHKACRNWPKGTVFKVAGSQEGPAS